MKNIIKLIYDNLSDLYAYNKDQDANLTNLDQNLGNFLKFSTSDQLMKTEDKIEPRSIF